VAAGAPRLHPGVVRGARAAVCERRAAGWRVSAEPTPQTSAPYRRKFIASVEEVSCCPDVPSRGMYSLLFDSAAPDLHMDY
jgi:hypothetical protein